MICLGCRSHFAETSLPLSPVSRTIAFALICGILTISLGVAANAGYGATLDLEILRLFALDTAKPTLSVDVAKWISRAGTVVPRTILVVIVASILMMQRRPRAALVMIVVPALTGTTTSWLKDVFDRVRPALGPRIDPIGNAAFPSGHASNAMAIALLMALLLPVAPRPHWIAIALLFAAVMGWSRLALGVHWPSDVVGGCLWGATFALTGYILVRRLEGAN